MVFDGQLRVSYSSMMVNSWSMTGLLMVNDYNHPGVDTEYPSDQVAKVWKVHDKEASWPICMYDINILVCIILFTHICVYISMSIHVLCSLSFFIYI